METENNKYYNSGLIYFDEEVKELPDGTKEILRRTEYDYFNQAQREVWGLEDEYGFKADSNPDEFILKGIDIWGDNIYHIVSVKEYEYNLDPEYIDNTIDVICDVLDLHYKSIDPDDYIDEYEEYDMEVPEPYTYELDSLYCPKGLIEELEYMFKKYDLDEQFQKLGKKSYTQYLKEYPDADVQLWWDVCKIWEIARK